MEPAGIFQGQYEKESTLHQRSNLDGAGFLI